MNNFAEWLTAQMQARDMSQADLARKSGLTRSTIHYYLSEKSKSPDEAALRKIASAFKLPPEMVFEKAGLLPPRPELSPIKRKLAHLAEDLPDSDVEIAIALLEQRQEYYKKNPQARPAK